MSRFQQLIYKIEQSPLPWWYFMISFFFIATIRNFLEIFSDHNDIIFISHLHYYASYVTLGLTLILILFAFTKTNILYLFKIVCSGFIILPLPPLLDLYLSGGKGMNISYMLPWHQDNLLFRFFTFFGSFDGWGITPGMRIEIAIILIMSFFYLKFKTKNFFKSFIETIILYAAIFIYCASPFLVKLLLETFGLTYPTQNLSLTQFNFFLFIAFPLIIIFFFFLHRSYVAAIIRDIRLSRLLHYLFMFLLGFLLTERKFQILKVTDAIFYFSFIIFSIICAWIFSVVTNNIADVSIDSISNAERPLVKKTIPIQDYKKIAWIAFILMVIYATVPGYKFLFLMLLFIGGYWLYSMPPFRLKRIPILSKFIIGLNSLCILMLGYVFCGASVKEFPISILFFVLIVMSIGINFIDIKDYHGDKAEGIKTLSTLVGVRASQWIMGFVFLFGYIALPIFLGERRLLPGSLILGIWCFIALTRKRYNEKWVFLPYLITLLILFIIGYNGL